MTVLKNIEFRALYFHLVKELENICKTKVVPMPTSKEAILGYGKSRDNTQTNLWTEMSNHPKVKTYIADYNKTHKQKKGISPNYLADCLKAAEDGAEEIFLDKKYERIFFLFLNCEDKEKFLEKFKVVKQEIKYEGYYYNSGRDKRVKNFTLRIDRSVDNSLHAYMKGFHIYRESEELYGTLRHHYQCWFIDLKRKDLYASIWIHISNTDLSDPDKLIEAGYLFGILNAVSTLGYPLSAECILRKQVNEPAINQSDINILRYLILMRNSFHVKLEENYDKNSVENLKVGLFGLNIIKDMHKESKMPKIYRILAHNPDGFTQSKLRIEDDYTTSIEMPEKKFKCFIGISSYKRLLLLISSYEEDGLNLSVFTAINSTTRKPKLKETKFEFIQGAFCNTGQENDKPVGNQFVMIEDDTAFKPQDFKKADLPEMRKNEKLAILVDELIRVGKDLTHMYSIKDE
jgi:hypothetical protein